MLLSIPRAQSRRTGLILVLFAATGFGLIPLFSRIGFADGLTPETAVIVRFGLPAALLCWVLPGALGRASGGWMLVGAGALMGVGSWGYFAAIERLPVALAAMIFFTYPFFVTAYRVALRDRVSRRDLGASALVALAIALILGPADLLRGSVGADPVGIAIGFLGPATFGALIIAITRAPAALPPLSAAACIFFGTVLTAVPLILIMDAPVALPQTTTGWLALAGLMTFVGLLPQIAYTSGAPAAGPSLSAIAGTLELVVALVIGWTVFGETPTIGHILGAGLLFSAITLAARA